MKKVFLTIAIVASQFINAQVQVTLVNSTYNESFAKYEDSGVRWGQYTGEQLEELRGGEHHWASQNVKQIGLGVEIQENVFLTTQFSLDNGLDNRYKNIALMIGRKIDLGSGINLQVNAGMNRVFLVENDGTVDRAFNIPIGDLRIGYKFVQVGYQPLGRATTLGLNIKF